MKTIKTKQFVVGSIVPVPQEQLMIQAACSVFDIEEEELFSSIRSPEYVQRRALLYYLLKFDLDFSDSDIARICKQSRQWISSAIQQAEFDVRNYLRVSCVVKDIRAVYANLRREQEEWLNSHTNNMPPLTPPSPRDP